MKILRVFGVVVGIHVFLLMLIFANPGCSSAGKPAPAPSDTVAKNDSSSAVNASGSGSGSGVSSADTSPLTSAPLANDGSSSSVSFNAPSSSVVRFSPTRPGTTAAAALETQPVADVTPATTYTVVSGDNLTVVAKRFKITIAELAAMNNLKPASTLRLGQKLIILPKPASAAAPTASAKNAAIDSAAAATGAKASASERPKHTVLTGETLGGIARKYGVTQGELGSANNITDPKKIRPGQELIIPPSTKTKSKSPGTSTSTPTATPPVSHDAAGTPSTVKPVENKTLFAAPPPGQDLDAGLKAAPANNVPVIKVQDAPANPPKNP